MPNIAAALKAEISRVARKEIRSETEQLKKAVSSARSEISSLKKDLRELTKALKAVQRGQTLGHTRGQTATAGQAAKAAPQDEGRQLRFSPTRLAAQRQKLGLTVANMAKLLGVSSVTLYKWESGQSRPRRAQLESIAAVRGIGKREALARLES
jgi:DNA-binding transcriptional regulator YiaG